MSRSPRRRRAKPSYEGPSSAGERSSGDEKRAGVNQTGKKKELQLLAHFPTPIILISQGHLRIELSAEGAFWLVAAFAVATASGFWAKRARRS